MIELTDEDRPGGEDYRSDQIVHGYRSAPVLLPIFFLLSEQDVRRAAKPREISLSTMSRHLLVLGHGSLALIQTQAEPGDARYIRYSLMEKAAEQDDGSGFPDQPLEPKSQ